MKWKSEQTERILWILAVTLGLALRLIKLGAAPLTDWEASNALPVFDWLKSGVLPGGSQAGYTLFSGLIFYVFGASNFSARFIPALAGGLLVLTPLLFRRQLGRWPALIAAFGLAFDPALVAISRQADGGIWALAFSLLGLGFLLRKRSIGAGVCLGLALLGGPALWIGWLGLGAALLLSRKQESFDPVVNSPDGLSLKSFWPSFLLAAGIALVGAGTLFFFAPFGLSMAGQSLPDFLGSWKQTGPLGLRPAAIALLSYATLPLVLGLLQAVSGWVRKDAVDQFLSVWLILALLLWFACPGRQLSYAGWVTLPLWALAARQAADWLQRPAFDVRFSVATAGVVFVLVFFMVLNAVAILHPAAWSAQIDVQIVKIVVALVLLGLAILLVGWGWNWEAAGKGVQWGVGAALAIILVSMSVHASGLSQHPEAELLRSGVYPADADLVQSTLHSLSTYKTGQFNQLQVTVVGVHSPALEWLLRDYADVQYSDTISTMESPDVILSSDQIQPAQISTYRGQDFVWTVKPAWDQMDGVNWMKWLVFRETPNENSKIILWARTNLFPGESAGQTAP